MDWLKAQAKEKYAPEAIDLVKAEGKDFTIVSIIVAFLKLQMA